MSSWLVALLSLLALGAPCLPQTCNSTITILITGNETRTLPSENNLMLKTNLSLPITWTIDNQVAEHCTNLTSCRHPPDPLMDGDQFNVSVTNGTVGFFLNVTVDADTVVCQNLSLGILLPSNLTLNCYPVASCNASEVDDLNWEIQYVRSEIDWETLETGSYMPPESTGLMYEEGDNMVIISDNGRTLTINRMTDAMIGYYRVISSNDMILSTFTVFLEVTYEDTYRLSVNVVEGEDEIFIPCHYQSFPPVGVTWKRVLENDSTVILNDYDAAKYSFVNINETEDEVENSGEHFDLSLTLNGGLIIHDVVIEDYGVYMCIGSNNFDTTAESVIFRVRSRLRPLWPALGIIGVFIITALFIFASYLFDRVKQEKERSIEPSEIDGEQAAAFQGRPSIISIENEDENSMLQKRAHSDGHTK